MARANSALGITALCLIFFFGVMADNDTHGNVSLPITTLTGNVSSIDKKQFSSTTNISVDSVVHQNGSAPDLQLTTRKITISDTVHSSGPVPQSSTVNKPDEKKASTTVNDVTQPNGSELASQSSGPGPLPTAVNKPEEVVTTARPTTVNNAASVTQPIGSELASKSSGPVPHPTAVNKPEEEVTIARPTTVNNGASVTQPTGSELPSQTAIVNQTVDDSLPSKVEASVTKPSALNIDTTAEKFLQSDKKVAAKPAVDDGYFIIYLILGSLLVSLVYITYHNKNKIISLCRRDGSRRTGRPNASEYQRLDQNLSEVMTILKKKTNIKMN